MLVSVLSRYFKQKYGSGAGRGAMDLASARWSWFELRASLQQGRERERERGRERERERERESERERVSRRRGKREGISEVFVRTEIISVGSDGKKWQPLSKHTHFNTHTHTSLHTHA